MPNYTEKYNLKKPLQDEFYNIDDHNGNMDIIEAELKRLSESSGVVISPDEPATGDVWIDTDDDSGSGGAVSSVNGKTGDVQLEAKDLDVYNTGLVYTKEEIIGLLNGKMNVGDAPTSHGHDVVDISGILPVEKGGTGVSSLSDLASTMATSMGACRFKSGTFTATGTSKTNIRHGLGVTPKLVFIDTSANDTALEGLAVGETMVRTSSGGSMQIENITISSTYITIPKSGNMSGNWYALY